ncbi:hypothetical protein Tco_1339246 [Tanacetum coccineum]
MLSRVIRIEAPEDKVACRDGMKDSGGAWVCSAVFKESYMNDDNMNKRRKLNILNQLRLHAYIKMHLTPLFPAFAVKKLDVWHALKKHWERQEHEQRKDAVMPETFKWLIV